MLLLWNRCPMVHPMRRAGNWNPVSAPRDAGLLRCVSPCSAAHCHSRAFSAAYPGLLIACRSMNDGRTILTFGPAESRILRKATVVLIDAHPFHRARGAATSGPDFLLQRSSTALSRSACVSPLNAAVAASWA